MANPSSYARGRTAKRLGSSPQEKRDGTLGLQRTITLASLAVVALLAGCGSGTDHANDPRPPATITVAAAVLPERVKVSPRSFGGGPVVIRIANLTDESQKVTVETDELGAARPGLRQTTSAINPAGTAELTLDLAEGDYTVSAGGDAIQAARVQVGAQRPSSQDQLLQP